MFELYVALKYLLPRKRLLSTSIISILSIFVISLVVWLVLVFLSVTTGIEKNWLKKLTSLNAPIRIYPTQNYYNSYYYLVDNISAVSNFSTKNISEKYHSRYSDPYNKQYDMEIPSYWPKRTFDNSQNFIDPVKKAFEILGNKNNPYSKKYLGISSQDISFQDYEISGAMMRLALNRKEESKFSNERVNYLTQMSYLMTFCDKNPNIKTLLIKPRIADLNNLLNSFQTQILDGSNALKDVPKISKIISSKKQKQKLLAILSNVDIKKVKTSYGKIYDVKLDKNSLERALSIRDVLLSAKIKINKKESKTIKLGLDSVEVLKADFKTSFSKKPAHAPLWIYSVKKEHFLPKNEFLEYGVLLPKSSKDSGIRIGDRGYLSYALTTSTSTQEQRIGIYVTGFYDPGVLPVGSRFLLVPSDITSTINAANLTFCPDGSPTNGIYVWIKDIKNAENVKNQIEKTFEKNNIGKFWKIDSYKDFEFSKDLLQQFQSDRTLFTLIALIIIVVACSNIISLLVLLVNDKKQEIAILQAMGASKTNIATIFGICGIIAGTISSLIGSVAAIITIKNIDVIVNLLSKIQGHDAFNPAFFGSGLPNELSYSALLFVIILTPIISLFAGLIPAIKAARISPSKVLRAK
jgi:lipoprotein-releasing system permease protein